MQLFHPVIPAANGFPGAGNSSRGSRKSPGRLSALGRVTRSQKTVSRGPQLRGRGKASQPRVSMISAGGVHREVTVTYCSGIYRRNCRAGKQVQGKEGEQRRENCSLHCLITSDSKVNKLVSRTELITINATASRLTDVRYYCRHGGYICDFVTPCSSQLNKQDI